MLVQPTNRRNELLLRNQSECNIALSALASSERDEGATFSVPRINEALKLKQSK
jgi:hypothetical protein